MPSGLVILISIDYLNMGYEHFWAESWPKLAKVEWVASQSIHFCQKVLKWWYLSQITNFKATL